MTACFSFSLLRPSFTTTDLCFPWHPPNPSRKIYPIFLRNDSNISPGIFARVLQQGTGVVSPDDVSFQPPAIETEGDDKEDARRIFDEFVPTDTDSEYKAPSSSTRARKKIESEDGFENRFKLRNGKEVFEEKAYLVGVERKGDTENTFGIEESLKELAQLADTAGLMVVGSTYQK